ncbi:protein spindle-F [Scaptodrosophila lebanonensis]|uniref:Protein spindle-F n=1 Tax=Drosophila lebanonensis TaxID=7225 RepID=A0A6J2TKT4_DROLE|nr:protein spindle-F [Scaptodrosophila lebanonensis]
MDRSACERTPTNSTTSSSEKMNYALQVALQTMKERCIQLQRRVSTMEEENQRLRDGSDSSAEAGSGDLTEVRSLRGQVADLQRQKEQLSEQINMVSNENRRLWSRLSQISKEQTQQLQMFTSSFKDDEAKTVATGANQNLIRSKTFTQHSPNPHLRQKMISDGMRDISLDEIALDDFGTGAGDVELGYPYGLHVENVSGANENDANVDAKSCMEGFQDLRREAMKQQQELSSALTLIETRIALQPCPDCAQKAAHKPEMADKSLETDEGLNSDVKLYHNEYTSGQVDETMNDHNGHIMTTAPTSRLNIIQEKLKADAMDKTCPMCGKMYSSQISFKAFQEHVEMHFIDDGPEVENSIERNFEFVSHVGDF